MKVDSRSTRDERGSPAKLRKLCTRRRKKRCNNQQRALFYLTSHVVVRHCQRLVVLQTSCPLDRGLPRCSPYKASKPTIRCHARGCSVRSVRVDEGHGAARIAHSLLQEVRATAGAHICPQRQRPS